jgi:hypothetical protein
MGNRRINREAHRWVIGILLTALVVRALIPVGFMPSAERPFTIEICPDGSPPQLLGPEHGSHHHHAAHENSRDSAGGTHQHDPSRSEHCAFALAAGMGPAPHPITAVLPSRSTAISYSAAAGPALSRLNCPLNSAN